MKSDPGIPRRRETGRLETFSDGIFAFAMTLLVLGLYDPVTRGASLLPGLWLNGRHSSHSLPAF